MNRREALFDELLSAYLDGEVSAEERRIVERRLDENPEYRQLLDDLCRLNDYLRMLPEYQVDESVTRRIEQCVADLAPSTDESLDHLGELISAYLDGELGDEDRRRVEGHLLAHSEWRRLLEQLRALGESLRALPTYRLDDDFAERVVRGAERRMLQAEVQEERGDRVGPLPESVRRDRHRSWRRWFWAGLAAAAAVLLIVGIRGGLERDRLEVVESPGRAIRSSVPSKPPKDASSPLVTNDSQAVPHQPDSPLAAPGSATLAAGAPGDQGWQMFAAIQRNTRQELLLVYELAVTPEGVEKGAFANLLKRHHIRFHQTVPVGPEQQAALLRHRFLQGVQVGDAERDDMDEVELYLVSCTARDADAIYRDLAGRPPGFASFFLNLTTKDAEDRVLGELCEASGIGTGQAVRLAANFAMLSRTARKLGVFGAIGWIDPSLLEPSLVPQADDGAPEQSESLPREPMAPGAEGGDDFPCELLFVVRNLKPLSAKEDGTER